MKKSSMAAAAAAWVACAGTALAGIGVLWTTGGWVAETGGSADAGPGVAQNGAVTWQLLYAGADGAPNEPDASAADCAGGDDEVLATREIPAGGGLAADGTEWDAMLTARGGYATYTDADWPTNKTGKVFQRIWQGTPGAGTAYGDGPAVAFNAAFAGGGQPPDTCYFDAGLRGVALDKTLTRPGDAFLVRKLYDGEHSVRTDLSTVELAVYSEAAANPDAHGGCLTYLIEGEGVDMTGNTDDNGERFKLNGIYDIAQANHYMVKFDDAGWTRITAKLKEGSVIRVTGEFGPYNPEYAEQAPNGRDRRRTLSTAGLLQGRTFYVIERSTPFGNGYVPTGYVYTGDDAEADPRVDATDMTATFALTANITDETDYITPAHPADDQATVPAGALFLKGTATGSATTVFVVNEIDENKVGTIEVDVTDWDAPYDGEGHGAAVTMLSTFSDDDGEPLYDWWRASYALGDAEGPTNDWSAGTPLFTNVCEQTVWMAFDADYWRSTTTSAVVRIRPAPLGITARDQTFPHDGRPHGEDHATYTDPADIASKVVVSGLAAGDVLASVTLDGTRTDPGTCSIVPSDAIVTNATGVVTSNYAIGCTNGTLTIEEPPPPVVSNVVARQRWPWNGLVDVDYEVGGLTTGLAVRISFEEQGGAGRTWVATNFLGNVVPSAAPGPHRATWDTKAAGATNVVAAEVVATVELVRTAVQPPLPSTGDGTYERPYACADLLAMELTTSSIGTGFVMGYIVGSVNGSSLSEATAAFGTEGASTSNLLLADSPGETDWSKCVPVKADNSFKAKVYPAFDSDAIGKKACLYGTLKKFLGASGVNLATYCELYSSDGSKTELGTKPQ